MQAGNADTSARDAALRLVTGGAHDETAVNLGGELYRDSGKEVYFSNKSSIMNNENSSFRTNGEESVTGARITDPDSKAATSHAERYYGLVRKMKSDVSRIATNTGFSETEIARVKQYLFLEEHNLGYGRVSRFDPDYAIAQSWQRLIAGKPEKHDITLLQHEILESNLVKSGISQDQAHRTASKIYNYAKEVREYYASIKEH